MAQEPVKEVGMLGDKDAMATIAVKDIKAAKKFYEDKLGLKAVGTEGPQVVTYTSGSSRVLVYVSQYAGTNKATAVTWIVDDVEGAVQAIKSKGVAFEHYDFPDSTRKGDVHVMGDRKAAWFKDPDGNILAIVSG
jgi:catechol 2,3-dioxygenase-like lactoylglutathione lyase family enzyme